MDNFGYNLNLLINKSETLFHNIDNGIINLPYFKGVMYYAPIVVQTEGTISKLLGMNTSGYLYK